MRAIQLKFLFYHQNCRNHSLGRFVGVRMGGHIAETNLRCGRSSGIYTPNLNSLALIVSEISAFIRTDRQTDRRTRLVILIKNMYTLWDRKRFLLPVTSFPTNLVYPFTLRVTGIMNVYINRFPFRSLSIFLLRGL